MTPNQWWDQFDIIYIFSPVIYFFFKTMTFEFNDQSLRIGTGLIRPISVQFV